MATKTRKKRPAVAAKPDTRETISPLDESLPKQPASLEGQQTLPVELPPGKPVDGMIRPGLVEWLKLTREPRHAAPTGRRAFSWDDLPKRPEGYSAPVIYGQSVVPASWISFDGHARSEVQV